MATVAEHLRRHLLSSLGVVETKRLPPLDVLLSQQRSERFERGCRYRMVMGAFRYGLLQDQRRGSPYDNVGSLIARARAYQVTGNIEHLYDIANLAMIEFEVGRHPQKHHRPTDDEIHTSPRHPQSLTPNP